MRGCSGATCKLSCQVAVDSTEAVVADEGSIVSGDFGFFLLRQAAEIRTRSTSATYLMEQEDRIAVELLRADSVVMRMFVTRAGGDHAAVRHFADGVFKLDGGVMNVEGRCQFLANLAQ